MTGRVKCEACGTEYTVPGPRGLFQSLRSEINFFDVAPELREAERATCPKCGLRQKAGAYRFFGVLTARGVRVLIALILVAMIMFAFQVRR